MPLPFSPRDIGSLRRWMTASKDDILFLNGSTDKLAKWKDRHSGSGGFTLSSADHLESNQVEQFRIPSLISSGAGSLNGRSTLSFIEGQYLIGKDDAWNTPYLLGTSQASMLPANRNHSFVLLRFLPPTRQGPDSEIYSNLAYEYSFQKGLKPRPGVWTFPFSSRASLSLEIEDWNPNEPFAAGSLRLSDQCFNTFRTAQALHYPVIFPFSKFGKWTLLEIVSSSTEGRIYFDGILAASISRISSQAREEYLRPVIFSSAFAPDSPRAFTELCNGGGNVAEILAFDQILSGDELNKVRAWILRRWGLGELISLSNPYKGGVIPGSSPFLPRAFPSLCPSTRTYTPGAYANSAFGGIGGVEQRVRHSSTGYSGDRLKLQFTACSEAETQAFMDHYALMQGGFKTFGLPPDALTNLGPVARHLNDPVSRGELAPRGSSWRYAGALEIRDQQLDINDVVLELELVREPLGLIISGEPASTEMVVQEAARLFYGQRIAAGQNAVQITVGDQTLGWERSDQGFGQTGIVEASFDGFLKIDYGMNGAAASVEAASDAEFIWGPFLDGEASALIDSDGDLLYGQAFQGDPGVIRAVASLGWDLTGNAAVQVDADGSLIFTETFGWNIASATGSPFLGATAATLTSGWSSISSSYGDDESTASGAFGFSFSLAGTAYSSCFVGSNGYITFGSGASTYSVSASNPSVPKVLFFGGDRSYSQVLTRAGTGSGGKFFKIRWEGSADYNSGSTDSFVEVTLFERHPFKAEQYLEVRYGLLGSTADLSIASSSSYYATGGGLATSSSSAVFTGNATGTAWTLESGKSVIHSL